MRAVVVGASAGLGRALARRLAARGADLVLAASDERDLRATATDIEFAHGVKATPIVVDLARLDAADFRLQALAALGGIDLLCLIAGRSGDLVAGGVPDATLTALVNVNLTAPMRLANVFLEDLRAAGGTIVAAGTVASIRPRRRNAPYAAAKSGLEFYIRALRHDLASDRRCKVQCYRLGYLATRMTAGQKLPLPALDPDRAAETIVENLSRDIELAYLPGWWLFVALVLGSIPRRLFDRLDL